jgi:hypothetical protein
MLSLNDIFGDESFGAFHRKILFEDGLWCIYEKIPDGMDLRFHLIHRCHPASRSISLKYDHTLGNHCIHCSEEPPDGILVLARLQRAGSGDTDGYGGELG